MHDMALPLPSTSLDLEPTKIVTHSEHTPQNDNAAPPTVPSAALQLAEPQRATPSMGSRCERCISPRERPIPTRAAICHFFHRLDRTCQHLKGQSLFVIGLTRMWRDGETPSGIRSPLGKSGWPFLGPSIYYLIFPRLGSVLTVIQQSRQCRPLLERKPRVTGIQQVRMLYLVDARGRC